MNEIETYEKVLSGKLANFPWGFWKGKAGRTRAKKILRYLREKESIELCEVPGVFTRKFLERKKLNGVIVQVFGGSTKKMIEFVWPRKFHEWELPSKGKWTGKKGRELAVRATKHLFKKLGIPRNKVAEYACGNLFQDYGLSGMLKWVYGNNVFLAVKAAYPEFEWEDLRHNIRSGQKFVSNHGHVHKSMFERRIDDYIGDLKLEHEHNVRYPGSKLDCDIVVKARRRKVKPETSRRRSNTSSRKGNIKRRAKVWVEAAGMIHLESYRKKMQKKREIAKKHKLKLLELYLKDDWKEIRKKIMNSISSR